MSNLQFDANEHRPDDGFDMIPAGDYLASIVESAVKTTKNQCGTYLELVWEIVDGEFNGRQVWHRIMLTHTSKNCVARAKRELSSVCHAVGVLQLNDSTQLHDIPTTIRVGVKHDDRYGPANEITKFPDLEKGERVSDAETPS